MADITITTSDGTKFTFAEGEVKQISSKITTNIEAMAISGTGASTAYLYDYEGGAKTITLSGILFETGTSRISGYSVDTIIEQKQWLESLCNGTQLPFTFTSNYESLSVLSASGPTPPYKGGFTNTKCMVQNLNFDEYEARVEELKFSLTITVGH